VVPQAGYELRLVDPIPLPRRLSTKLFTLPFRILKSVRQAKNILRDNGADVVIGFGGYASLPVVLAAWRLKTPCVVHEANAVPGLANRIAARFARVVCVTFENTGLAHQVVTGMPVSHAIAQVNRGELRTQARNFFGLESTGKVLLVSGGSQGAQSLNEATLGAMPSLAEAGVWVIHVTGKKNYEELTSAIPNYIRVPYVERMDLAYAAADLMLARSGAATVNEVARVGLPTIFVPLPHGNGEQAKNAASVVAAGGGILINNAELSSTRLAQEVIRLMGDDAALAHMGAAAQDVMPSDAASRVAQYALNSAKGSHASD